jgi:16S rRNA (adenine1518-N6/adenine1519-N6)-dimethyltransferase
VLGASQIRRIAEELDLNPSKKLGQNFVHDANTVRRIVQLAEVTSESHVIEVGPGLGSLTLGLLETGAKVVAVEVDDRLAKRLRTTISEHAGEAEAENLTVLNMDALKITRDSLEEPYPEVLVANLPYNVSVPIFLHLLSEFPEITRALVMVQAEVGERLAATPGSKIYGGPSVKAASYGELKVAATVPRNIFWPVPNVDSVLVSFQRNSENDELGETERTRLFNIIEAAFSQRRKMLRQSLSGYFGSSARASEALKEAGIDPTLRAETLSLSDFLSLVRITPLG